MLRSLLIVALFVAMGCKDDPPPTPVHPPAPVFRSLDITGQVQEMVDPDTGTTLTLGGARLEIPPGALAGPVEITLVEMANPAAGLRVDDGGLDGQTFLWNSTYTFIADRQVDLNAPIFLDLPVDPALLPVGMSAAQGQISAVTGGFVVVQGEEASATDTHLRMSIDTPFLPDGPSFSGGARAFGGVPFVLITSGLLASGSTLQGLVATIDDVRSVARFSELQSEHFRIRYRATTMDKAQSVANLLEDTHAYMVEELGFTLPNQLNLDGRYTIYLDDFANQSFRSAGFPDGMTLPGSVLIEGASYINIAEGKLPESFESVAVHEYVHQLQYGALTRILPNATGRASDLQGGWLFEGTATLMAGRMTGGNLGPRIDRALQEHWSPRWSIFAIPRAVDPPNDAAQELFYFIEEQLGTTDHYRAFFEQLGTDLPFAGEREPSVSAVEEVLRARGQSLGELYGAWVRDYLFDRPEEYGNEPPPEVPATLDVTGTRPNSVRLTLPPLGYDHRVYTVPEIEPGTTPDNAPTDVEVTFAITSGDPSDAIVYVELEGEVEVLEPSAESTEESTTFFRVRTDFDQRVRIALANRGLDNDATLSIDLTVNLTGEGGPPPDGVPDAEEGIVIYNAEMGEVRQLRGNDIADGSSWIVTSDATNPLLLGASAQGEVLVGEVMDERLSMLLVIDDFGRGTSRDVLPGCPGLVGNAHFGRIATDGRVWFIGDIDVEGDNRPAVFRDGAAGCAQIPIDFDGDGRDDTGNPDVVYTGLVVSNDGSRLGLQGADMTFYTAPASGGRADATALAADALVVDSLNTPFAIAADGNALTATRVGELMYAAADGSDAVLLGGASRTGGVLFASDQVVFPVEAGFALQRPDEDVELVDFPDDVSPFGALVRSPESNLICFIARDPASGDESGYCSRASGAALERVVQPADGIEFSSVHYWPDR